MLGLNNFSENNIKSAAKYEMQNKKKIHKSLHKGAFSDKKRGAGGGFKLK